MEKKEVTRHFRCTKEESGMIDEKAAMERKSASAYIRDAALARAIPKVDPETAMLLKQIQDNELKIGVNINQAVRLCNSKKHVSSQDYEILTGMLIRIMEYRKKVYEAIEKTRSG